MLRFFIKFISMFILDKDKRKQFREKYDPVERLKIKLSKTREILFEVSDNLWQIYPQCLKLNSYFHNSEHISVRKALDLGIVKSYEEHKQNVKNLKKNLEPDDLSDLNKILNRIEINDYFPLFIPEVMYNSVELEQWYNFKKLSSEFIEQDGVFIYKNYKIPVNKFLPTSLIYKHGFPELKTLNNLSKDDVLIDAGSYIMDSALVMRDFLPNKIISFEPDQYLYNLCLKTVQLNNMENIVLEKAALSDKTEQKLFKCGNEKDAIVQYYSLDDYVEKNNLKVGLIKTDIEGFEMNLLKGAQNTIIEQKPILVLSIYHSYNDFYKIKPFIESLNLGYKFKFFKGIDEQPFYDILLLAEVY